MATIPERVLNRVRSRASIDSNGCWIWPGTTSGSGYGVISWSESGEIHRWVTHRVTFTSLVGPIPAGLELDHLCRVRRCCNPAHLEPVTRRENLIRSASIVAARAAQTHCLRGHAFTDANTRRRGGSRICRACDRLRKSVKPSSRTAA